MGPRDLIALALLACLWFFGLYYLCLHWIPIPIVLHRVLRFYIAYAPLTGSSIVDCLVVAISLFVLLLLAKRVALGAFLSMASLSSILLTSLGGYAQMLAPYALCIPCFIAIGILYRDGWARSVVNAFAIAALAASFIGICSAITYFSSGRLSAYALRALIVFRAFWGIAAWLSIAILGIFSALWSIAMATRSHRLISYVKGLLKHIHVPPHQVQSDPQCSRWRGPALAVALGSAIALCVVLLPHVPTVDPGEGPISVDTFYYMKFINYARIHGLTEALRAFHSMARPLYLLAVYGVSHLVSPRLFLDIIQPVITSVAIVAVCTAIAVRIGGSRAALYSAILVGGGRQVLTFVAGGFQANALALPIALTTLLVNGFGSYVALLTIAALIHPWTALFVGSSIALYMWFRSEVKEACKRLAAVAVALSVSTLVDWLVGYASAPHAVASVLSRAVPNPITNLFRGVALWTWSTMLNPPTQLLASLCLAPTPVTAMLALLSPLTLVNSLVVYRALLDTSLEVQSSIALTKLSSILATSITLSSIAYTLTTEIGLTPLTAPLWTSIAKP